jgi:hypothetical protein
MAGVRQQGPRRYFSLRKPQTTNGIHSSSCEEQVPWARARHEDPAGRAHPHRMTMDQAGTAVFDVARLASARYGPRTAGVRCEAAARAPT